MSGLRNAAEQRLAGKAPAAPAAAPTPKPVPQGLDVEVARTRQQTRADFRSRRVDSLKAERGQVTDDAIELPEVGEAKQDSSDPARQVEKKAKSEPSSLDPDYEDQEGQPDDADDSEAIAQASDNTATEGDDSESVDESDEEDSITTQLQARVEELEDEHANLERGFRQKTHRLAESQRNLEDQMVAVETNANFYASLANQAVSAFDNIDWGILRTRPEEYQKATRDYERAIQNRDRLVRTLTQLQSENAQRRELFKQQQASVSRDMLPSEIKGWSKDRFEALQKYAVDTSGLYTDEEFEDITDWRVMKLLHIAENMANAPKDIGSLKVKGGKKQSTGKPRISAVKTERDATGRFVKAKKEMQQAPGNRTATRNFFIQKLAAERESGRR